MLFVTDAVFNCCVLVMLFVCVWSVFPFVVSHVCSHYLLIPWFVLCLSVCCLILNLFSHMVLCVFLLVKSCVLLSLLMLCLSVVSWLISSFGVGVCVHLCCLSCVLALLVVSFIDVVIKCCLLCRSPFSCIWWCVFLFMV